MRMQAIWNGKVIADSDDTVVIEGNHYFPASHVDPSALRPSSTTTVCGWKGTASYHTVVVDGAENADAAWFYQHPKPSADAITARIAFWKGSAVTPAPESADATDSAT